MNMSSMTLQQHRCRTANNKDSRCHFCSICGIYMSKSIPRTLFYRSARYNVDDPLKLDGNFILTEMVKKQSFNRFFNAQANHISYRSELISFVEEVAIKLEYTDATYYLGIAILDALLSLYSVDLSQVKLVGYMALNLAAKIHENSAKIPELTSVVQLFENKFDIEEIANCENLLAQVLGYNVNLKTPYTFVDYFLSRGVVSEMDIGRFNTTQIHEKTAQFEKLVAFFLQISASHYEFYKFTSVAVATSVIACARKLMGFDCIWTDDLENLTQVSSDAIEQCSQMLYDAAQELHTDLSPQSVLGTSINKMECPALISGFKSRGSILTEATSEKDDSCEEQPFVSEFSLSDSDEEENETAVRFVVPFNFNC